MLNYSDTVIEHAANPRNTGQLEQADAIGTEGEPGSGPFMEISLIIRADTICDIRFKTYGCAAAIASCSKLTEMVKGRTVADAMSITPSLLLNALDGLPLGKRHCPDMAIAALWKALACKDPKNKVNHE